MDKYFVERFASKKPAYPGDWAPDFMSDKYHRDWDQTEKDLEDFVKGKYSPESYNLVPDSNDEEFAIKVEHKVVVEKQLKVVKPR